MKKWYFLAQVDLSPSGFGLGAGNGLGSGTGHGAGNTPTGRGIGLGSGNVRGTGPRMMDDVELSLPAAFTPPCVAVL